MQNVSQKEVLIYGFQLKNNLSSYVYIPHKEKIYVMS